MELISGVYNNLHLLLFQSMTDFFFLQLGTMRKKNGVTALTSGSTDGIAHLKMVNSIGRTENFVSVSQNNYTYDYTTTIH